MQCQTPEGAALWGTGLASGTMTMKHVCLCYADTHWQGPQGQHGSSDEGNAHHPLGTTQSQAPAITEMHHRKSVAQESRTGQGGLYRPSRPTSTHQRPREHTATHDRPRRNRQQGQVCLLPVFPAGEYSLQSWQLTTTYLKYTVMIDALHLHLHQIL